MCFQRPAGAAIARALKSRKVPPRYSDGARSDKAGRLIHRLLSELVPRRQLTPDARVGRGSSGGNRECGIAPARHRRAQQAHRRVVG